MKIFLSWLIFATILGNSHTAARDERGESWIIKSNVKNEQNINRSPIENSNVFSRSKVENTPDNYFLETRTLDRPTREPNESRESFETALSEPKNESRSTELKNTIASDGKQRIVNNYLLRVDEKDLAETKDEHKEALLERSEISNVTKGHISKFSSIAKGQSSEDTTAGTAAPKLTQTNQKKERQDIEESPESYAGEKVGKAYGDPDGYQTIGDGIYLMSAEQEAALTPGANTQSLEVFMKPDHSEIGELTSNRKSTHTSEQVEEPALEQTNEQTSEHPGEQTSEHPGEQTSKNSDDHSGEKYSENSKQQASDTIKNATAKDIAEPSGKNIDQILTKLDTDDPTTSPISHNDTANANNSTDTSKEAENSPSLENTENKPDSVVSQDAYVSKSEPPTDIEDVTPKELQVLQTFQNTLKREDKQISKVMLAKTVDRGQEAYTAKTNAMLQKDSKKELDSVLDKLKSEDSAFIKKNPYVADKNKLLNAILNAKYKDVSATKRGFLGRNDNIPVQNLYNTLLKEDDWLSNGMNYKDGLKFATDKQMEDTDDSNVKEFLKFAANEDEKLAEAVHPKASYSKASHKVASHSKTLSSGSLHRKSKKGKKNGKIPYGHPQLLVIEPSIDLLTTSSSSHDSHNIKNKTAKQFSQYRESDTKDSQKSGSKIVGMKTTNDATGQERPNLELKNTESGDSSGRGEGKKWTDAGNRMSGKHSNDKLPTRTNPKSPVNDDKGPSKNYANSKQIKQINQDDLNGPRQEDRVQSNYRKYKNKLKKYSMKRKQKSSGKNRKGISNLSMKEGELTGESFTNKQKPQKQKPSKQKDDKDYYWHGTQKPETRQLPTDPAEQIKKFGQVSNMLPPSLHDDSSFGESRYIGNKNNIASFGADNKKQNNGASDFDGNFRDLKEYGEGVKDYQSQLNPINKINENDLSSTSFFSATKSSAGSQKDQEKQDSDVLNSNLMKDAMNQIESKDMQDVNGIIDGDASKTLAFFDQKSLEPKLEEFDDLHKQHLKRGHRHKTNSYAKKRKQLKVVLHLPEIRNGETADIHGKDSDYSIGSIQDLSSEFMNKNKKKKPDIGQQIAQDDENTLEALLSKPTSKLIEFHQPTSNQMDQTVPEDSVGQEAKEWSKNSENKETIPLTGSNAAEAKEWSKDSENKETTPLTGSNERQEMLNAFTGRNILNLIKENEEYLPKNFENDDAEGNEENSLRNPDASSDEQSNLNKLFVGQKPHKSPRKKDKNGVSRKQRQKNKNKLKVSASSQNEQDNSEQGSQDNLEQGSQDSSEQGSQVQRGDDLAPNIYAAQEKYEQKQREVSELMPTEAVNQIKAILNSDDHSMPMKFLESDRQMFDSAARNQDSERLQQRPEVMDSKPKIQEEANRPQVTDSKPQIEEQSKRPVVSDSKPGTVKPGISSNLQAQKSKKEPNSKQQEVQSNLIDKAFYSNLLPSSRKIDIKGGKIIGGNIKGGLIRGGFVNGGFIEGGSILGGRVEGGRFRNGRMENGTLFNGTVEGGVIRGGEIYGGKMVSGLMEGGKLRGGSVDGGRLTGGEIDGGSLISGEVQGGFLKKGSVEGGILKGGSIEGGHLLGGVMLGGHLRGGVVKSGIIRGGIIEGGVVEGGVIDDGVVIKGGVTREYKEKTPTSKALNQPSIRTEPSSEISQDTTDKSKKIDERSENSAIPDKYQSSNLESPTSMYKINVDAQNQEENGAISNTQNQQNPDISTDKPPDNRENNEISILGAPESWPINNKDLGKQADNDKHKVAPVTYAHTVQAPPQPIDAKQDSNTGAGKTASTTKLRALLKDLDAPKANQGQQRSLGERNDEEFSKPGAERSQYIMNGFSKLNTFKRPTLSSTGSAMTTRTIQDPSRKPAVVKYHWSLNSARGGKILGSPGKDMSVIGGVKIHNGIATLNDGIARGYLDAGDFQGECVSDPDVCKNGLTISMTNKIAKDSIESPTRMYLFDSGAGSEDSRGMALWVNKGRIEGALSSRKGTWCLSEDIRPFADRWVDLSLTWKPTQGLYLFANCQLLAISGFGRGCDVCSKRFCHQTDSNTHLMIARPNKGPHFKLTHFSSGDISVYEDFFTIDGVKEHCGSNNDYLRKKPILQPVRVVSHLPIKSPWDSTVNVMKKHEMYGGSEFSSPEKSSGSDEFQVWPTPSGINNLHEAAGRLLNAKASQGEASQASARQGIKVDGGYSEWTPWTPCLGACGGTSMSVRYCNNPVPKPGALDCSIYGPARRTRVCSLADCLDNSKKAKVEKLKSLDSDISKRKEITRSQTKKVNQLDDMKILQEEFKELQQR